MTALFWVSVVAALYPMLLYPVLIRIVGAVRPQPVVRGDRQPTVSILVPAFNEAAVIARTLAHLLAQDYPRRLTEIIVVSDASSDGTDAIVEGHGADGVRLLRNESRAGKAEGLNRAVKASMGEIIVFCDANAWFAPSTVSRLVENFADATVGYVTGALQFQSEHGVTSGGGGAYLRYENALREAETLAGSIIGSNGGVDAIRRDLYLPIPQDQITDFVLPLSVLRAGLRVVFDPRALSSEAANEDMKPEFRMRVRVALRALRGLWYVRDVMDPVHRPFVTFCILSHKVGRYLTFVALVGAFISNAALAPDSAVYAWLFVAQLALYALAALALTVRLPDWLQRLATIPAYYVASNAAFALAVFRFLRGQSMATWQPRAG